MFAQNTQHSSVIDRHYTFGLGKAAKRNWPHHAQRPDPSTNIYKVSEAIRCKAEMQEECRSNGDSVFADTEIWMFPLVLQEENQDLFAALVHELAHVAVSRLLARKYRPFKSGHIQTVNSAVMLEEEMHGPTYRKALRRFALRVEAAWGQETAKKIWQELESI